MVPVAGSAIRMLTQRSARCAWIIGWDLVLEYAIGSAAVANGWSNYFVEFTRHMLHIQIDPRLLSPLGL